MILIVDFIGLTLAFVSSSQLKIEKKQAFSLTGSCCDVLAFAETLVPELSTTADFRD